MPQDEAKEARKRVRDEEADARRGAFRRALLKEGLNPTTLAQKAGLQRPNALHNFLNGQSQSLSVPTMEKIAPHFKKTDLFELMNMTRDGKRTTAKLEDFARPDANKQALKRLRGLLNLIKKDLGVSERAFHESTRHIAQLEARLEDLQA